MAFEQRPDWWEIANNWCSRQKILQDPEERTKFKNCNKWGNERKCIAGAPSCVCVGRGEDGELVRYVPSEMTEIILATMASLSVELLCHVTLKCLSFMAWGIRIITLYISYKTILFYRFFFIEIITVLLWFPFSTYLSSLVSWTINTLCPESRSHPYFSYSFW